MDSLSQVVSPKQQTAWVYFSSFFQVVSPKQWTAWVKWSVLTSGQLEFTFLFCFKWSLLTNGQLDFTFRLCFKWSVLTNGQLAFTFLSFFEWSVPKKRTTCVYLSFSQGSSPVCLVKFCLHLTIIPNQYSGTPSFSPVKLHYPLAESDPFLNKFKYPIGTSCPGQNVFAVLNPLLHHKHS